MLAKSIKIAVNLSVESIKFTVQHVNYTSYIEQYSSDLFRLNYNLDGLKESIPFKCFLTTSDFPTRKLEKNSHGSFLQFKHKIAA